MFSNEQRIERLKKLSEILKVLPYCSSIKHISEKTNIPTSTIQRYLNNKKLFVELYIEEEKTVENSKEGKEAYEMAQKFLDQSRQSGYSRGGQKSQELHGFQKDELGKFIGGRK